ncbi:MAG: hypothetical protein WCT53_00315 [Candidatus Gracilibacteria bacterium]
MIEQLKHFAEAHAPKSLRDAFERLTSKQSQAKVEEFVDQNRRKLLIGGGAAVALILAGGGSLLLRDGEKEIPPVRAGEGGTQQPTSPQPTQPDCQEKPIDQMFADLKKDFPQLEKEPRLILNIEDERVYHFLECSSLESLKTLGILNPEKELPYLNISKMWEQAVRRNSNRQPYSDKMQAAPNENLSIEGLAGSVKSGMNQFQEGALTEAGLDNGYSKYLTPELLIGIFIQEVTPMAVADGKIKIKPKARLELFRMMIGAGWQPQKMPALYDSAISFGLGQMTLPTHKGLQKAYSGETDGIINHELIDHTSSQQQINNVLLLSYANMDAFSFIAKKYPHFQEIFEKAEGEDKMRFLTTVLAAYHNYGDRRSLRKRIKQTLGQDINNLEQYRTTFIENIKKLRIAYNHSRNSGTLYSFLMHRGCASPIAGQNAKEDGEEVAIPETEEVAKAEVDEEERQDSKITEDTLLILKKQSKAKGHKQTTYYRFTVPPVKLKEFMSYILKPPYTAQDVKRFNGVKIYRPGDTIDIPVKFLPADMSDRKFVKIQVSEGQDAWGIAKEHMEGGISTRNRALVVLYGSTEAEVRFPARLLKD